MTRHQIPQRKLHSGHFAFMRALTQGLDERASWNRYLSLEGKHTDLRQVRWTIAWIRDEFAAAARRERRCVRLRFSSDAELAATTRRSRARTSGA